MVTDSRRALCLLVLVGCTAAADVPAPAVGSIAPRRVTPGGPVQVSGSSFCQQPPPDPTEESDPLACAHTGALTFGLATGTITAYTDSTISAIAPSLPSGTYDVAVDVAGRRSNSVSVEIEP